MYVECIEMYVSIFFQLIHFYTVYFPKKMEIYISIRVYFDFFFEIFPFEMYISFFLHLSGEGC